MIVRPPAVAGQFYMGSAQALNKEVAQYIEKGVPQIEAIGAVCPHAGLMYSGHVAGAVYSRIVLPEVVVLLGPNHTGLGQPVSMMGSGRWEVPNGWFDIDQNLAKRILSHAEGLVKEDHRAHLFEHSLEVQLPFMAYLGKPLRIVPITFMRIDLEGCLRIGEAISEAIKDTEVSVTMIASTDMSHYVSDPEARKMDHFAIEKILEIDPEGLYKTVEGYGISMCGYIPTTVMLQAAKVLGARKAELVKYATSGEISGDYEHVVGYAGVVVY